MNAKDISTLQSRPLVAAMDELQAAIDGLESRLLDPFVNDFSSWQCHALNDIHMSLCKAAGLLRQENSIDTLAQRFKRMGEAGAKVRHARSGGLKAWAIEAASSMRGSHMEIARALSWVIPPQHLDASEDPERLIYTALRDARKARMAASRDA